ncbi:DUF262 domain-containing protein [Phenylobacterium sp.]|jgi:hypothetical protein|uniref:DUF262 domain-containing protein n=1 Tax=Phenylobacterium sp. TaxID=1871053 RepID=UPI003784AFBF
MSEAEIVDDELRDGIDGQEDTSGSGGSEKPWDPGKIRITTKAFSLREVVDQIRSREIDLAPDFQREYVWSARQRTRLIESILLGIPLPAFYFNQAFDGTYQVVDGVQRLSTIALFMGGGHQLQATDLEYLTSLDAAHFDDLDGPASRRFRTTQIVVHVIEPQTPDEVKFDIFNRVNTLGSPLSSQEVRHAMSRARSREFLARLAESPEFDKATEKQYWRTDKASGVRIRDGKRMSDRELVLRFCAFRNFSVDAYREHESLDAYLNEFTKRIDGVSERNSDFTDEELAQLETDFKRAMVNAHAVLGVAAFRRWPLAAPRRGPINRALFEAQGNALADYDAAKLKGHKEKIQSAFRGAFDDARYLRAVTVGTGDPSNITTRLEITRNLLAEAIAS